MLGEFHWLAGAVAGVGWGSQGSPVSGGALAEELRLKYMQTRLPRVFHIDRDLAGQLKLKNWVQAGLSYGGLHQECLG